MTVFTAAPPARRPSSLRARCWLAASAVVAGAASLYASIVAGLVRQWYEDPNAAYGALVAVAAVVAFRQRWPRLRSLPIELSSWSPLALLAAAGLYLAGTLAADVFLLRVSLVVLCAAAWWFVCGTAYLRALAVPLVLVMCAVPMPAAVVTELTMPLQLAASQCASGLLGLMGIDVVRDGNVIVLPSITLEVAEACSGMRSLATLLALVAVHWGTSGSGPQRSLVLAAATVPVAIAGNGLRVAVTGLLASRMGEDAARGLTHDATGFIAFLVMCGALVALYAAASWCVRPRAATA